MSVAAVADLVLTTILQNKDKTETKHLSPTEDPICLTQMFCINQQLHFLRQINKTLDKHWEYKWYNIHHVYLTF